MKVLCIFISFKLSKNTNGSEIIFTFLEEETEAERAVVNTLVLNKYPRASR
jgi:hypothetical protein